MAARCLDLTRSLSRVGRGPATGIDRVERAYLTAILAADAPAYGLVRTAWGDALLDRRGLTALKARLDRRTPWGGPDLPARLSRRLSPARRAAEADVRRLAVGTAPRWRLAALLARHLPPDATYVNVGHSNLSTRVLGAVAEGSGRRCVVLVHDTIPLDFPQFQRPGTPDVFRRRMQAVSTHADRVICNSAATASDVARHFTAFGRVPPLTVAHLGIATLPPDPSQAPAIPTDRPYFLTVGTIEPRKNHALLLDVWAEMAETGMTPPPRLVIAGSRGWNNDAVFARLDRADPDTVVEVAGVPDGGLSALMQGAAGVLFPSVAEGFGLPPAEAAAMGVPVVCAPLPVYREFLGDAAIYAESRDLYSWRKEIEALTRRAQVEQRSPHGPHVSLPTWEAHFKVVLNLI
ncbi:glycosyltransferase family 1 protein [Rhodobacteraceae bacterium CCMM004]|nr:glycosyltransferase family 1 protein [Rhodobacteraceae bacterium CCMM004]